MKLKLLLLAFAVAMNSNSKCSAEDVMRTRKDIKLLVLIIASDQFPIYVALQKVWKSYMHYDPSHVEAYFIRGDASLPSLTNIVDDVIWSRTSEGWVLPSNTPQGFVPASAGIINKTVLSLEAMKSRFHEFDYILRTNLSSFYNFPRLLEFLKTLPKTKCYCGSGEGFASGCGFILSPDVADMLIEGKDKLLNNTTSDDDVLIAHFLRGRGIKHIPHFRLDVLTPDIWEKVKHNIPANTFHFRIKGPDSKRIPDDIYIHNELCAMFYGH